MTNQSPNHVTHFAAAPHPPINLLAGRFEALAAAGRCSTVGEVGHFLVGGEVYHLPRFVYRAPDEHRPLRVGIFTGLRGNLEGGLALLQFLENLEANPWRAAGYELWIYPLCNPTGHEDGGSTNRRGVLLDHSFWKESAEPEVMLLERELAEQRFDAVITLYTDPRFDQFTGSAMGGTVAERLLESGLAVASATIGQPALELPWPDGALSVQPRAGKPKVNLRFGVPRTIAMRPRVTALSVTLGGVLASARHYLEAR